MVSDSKTIPIPSRLFMTSSEPTTEEILDRLAALEEENEKLREENKRLRAFQLRRRIFRKSGREALNEIVRTVL